MTIQETLKILDELEEKATKGEWKVDNVSFRSAIVTKDAVISHTADEEGRYGTIELPNSEFIVALHNAYPSLRAEIERLQGERSHLMQYIIDMAVEHGYKDFAAYLNKVDRGEDR